MLINKIGSHHRSNGINNQDSGFEYNNFNCIVDGCSGGNHSEVGAKLYAKKLFEYLKQKMDSENSDKINITNLIKIFEEILDFVARPFEINYSEYLIDVHNYMLFTILVLEEGEDVWDFYIAGDGFVITQDHDDNIKFHDIDHAPIPMYLAYAYIDNEYLDISESEKKNLKKPFKHLIYTKKEYKAIGIASDGIAYVVGTHYEEAFKKLLLTRKDFLIKRFINKMNYSVNKLGGSGFFKDDITISMR